MRNTHELYKLALEKYDGFGSLNGICYRFRELFAKGFITLEEYNKISDDFRKHKPTLRNRYRPFVLAPTWFGTLYWWTRDKSEPRKAFLEARIKDTSTWWKRLFY